MATLPKTADLKAAPPESWIKLYSAWLVGECKGSSEQWQGKSSIVAQEACGGQARGCWAVLDHNEVQSCQEVVDHHRYIAVQAECQVCGGCYYSPCIMHDCVQAQLMH